MLPEGWRSSTIGAETRFQSGGTPSKENPGYWGGSFSWVSARDMKTMYLRSTTLGLTADGRAAAAVAPANAVLVLTRGMTLLKDLPVCLIEREMGFNQDIKALLPKGLLDARFLAYQLLARKSEILNLVDTAGHGTGRLDTELLKDVALTVPPLGEQSRIAELIGTWDKAISVARELWAKRMEEAEILREKLVGAILQHKAVSLVEVADVRTGLAKGKTGQRDTIEVPYLRVANVQDGRLDLKEVKLIEVAREHVGRYSLQAGDVLMTEGGDFDKLGRGTVWSGEIDLCLHQNHVFAVRPKLGRVHSGFVAAIAASNYGRSYFMSCAKRSTNLASINSTQLKALPIPLVSMAEQERIVAVIDTAMQVAHGTQKMVDRLIQEKAALMTDLLTGKRRVKLNAEAVSTP